MQPQGTQKGHHVAFSTTRQKLTRAAADLLVILTIPYRFCKFVALCTVHPDCQKQLNDHLFYKTHGKDLIVNVIHSCATDVR